MDSLLVGALLALSPLPSARAGWIGILGALAGLLVVVLSGRTIWFSSRPMMTFGYSALALLYVSMLSLALRPGTWAQRCLSVGWLRFFGKYSYGLYLWHYIFSEQMLRFSQWIARVIPVAAAASLLSFAVSLSAFTLIAVMSFSNAS